MTPLMSSASRACDFQKQVIRDRHILPYLGAPDPANFGYGIRIVHIVHATIDRGNIHALICLNFMTLGVSFL